MCRNLENARLILNGKIWGVNVRELGEQIIVLEELWPIVGQLNEIFCVIAK